MKQSKELIIIIISLATIILLSTLFSGCLTTKSKQRSGIDYLRFSYDGTKMLSIANAQEGSDLQIWDVDSGEEIWRQFPTNPGVHGQSRDAFFSSDGSQVAVGDSIYDISSGNKITNFTGYHPVWSRTGDFFITVKTHSEKIEVWNASSFSIITTISADELILPYVGASIYDDKIVYIPCDKNTIAIVNLSSNSKNYSEHVNLNFEYEKSGHRIFWSKNGEMVGFNYAPDNFDSDFLFVWNTSNGELLYNISIDESEWPILSPDFEKYGARKSSGGVFEIFNISTNSKLIEIKVENIHSYDWSKNGGLIAIGNGEGIIKIFNASNGNLIKMLETPIHTYETPGFEILILFIAACFLIFLKRKKDR